MEGSSSTQLQEAPLPNRVVSRLRTDLYPSIQGILALRERAMDRSRHRGSLVLRRDAARRRVTRDREVPRQNLPQHETGSPARDGRVAWQ